jgi:hypothetical protein
MRFERRSVERTKKTEVKGGSRCIALFVCSVGILPIILFAEQSEKSYYLIGNSLTWDTVPSRLDGDVQWHVDCGKSLPWMFDDPAKPCVKTSTLWPQGLKAKQYDFVSVQPHYGSTLEQDVRVISAWLKMQPKAVFIIHTGWAHHAKRDSEYANKDATGKMQHSPVYIQVLLAELRKQHPDRVFRQTHAIDLLAKIANDVAHGKSPFVDVADLHRDAIHMKLESGRYLMHNAMRHALGQPTSSKGFEKLDSKIKQYLDGVLNTLSGHAE